MSVGITAPALLPMLIRVALVTQRHQVRMVQRDRRVRQVVRRDRLPVMDLRRRSDDSFLPADLTQPTLRIKKRPPAIPPGP